MAERHRFCVYSPTVSKVSGLGGFAALMVMLLACSRARLDEAKDAGGSDRAAESAARDAPADSTCGPDVDFMNDPNNCGGCGIRC